MDIKQIVKEVSSEMSKEGRAREMQAMLAEFLRRCLSKLAEQDGIQPVAHAVLEGRDTADSGWGYIAAWPEACHEHINEAIVEHEVEGAGDWKVVALHTEAQYIAAQQKAAEACATVFERAISYQPDADKNLICRAEKAITAIRSGDWRKYQ